MNGSLALHRSLLYVGSEAKTARIRVYDLDGHLRFKGFEFRDPRTDYSRAAGLAVDEDRRIWICDTPASRLRRFLVFGREDGGLGLGLQEEIETEPWLDRRGVVRAPLAVAVSGHGEEGRLAVGMHGDRRHAVQIFDVEAGYLFSPAPMGRPHGIYRGVRGVDLEGRFLYVAEEYAQRIQVFRDGDFHFAFGVSNAGARFEPMAVRALADGRLVIATGGAFSSVLLVNKSGRLLSILAGPGEQEGQVEGPGDLVVEEGKDDASTRVAVIDQAGLRVQILTLAGRCYGSFAVGDSAI